MTSPYSIYHPNILDRLKSGDVLAAGEQVSGQVWFLRTVTELFVNVARAHGCDVTLSEQRLLEARNLWLDDINRARTEGGNGIDHYKQAGFLVYWLRRRMVVNRIDDRAESGLNGARREFSRFGNEKASFVFGFRLCLGFATRHLPKSQRLDVIEHIDLTPEFRRDTAILLHHKQVSPHALYLIYRALFMDMTIPDGDDDEANIAPTLGGRHVRRRPL